MKYVIFENKIEIKYLTVFPSVLTVWLPGLLSNSLWPEWLFIGGGDFRDETVSILATDGTIFGFPLSSAKFCSIHKTIVTIRYVVHTESDLKAMWNYDHNFVSKTNQTYFQAAW